MADFYSSIYLPEGVYRNLTGTMPNIDNWIKDDSIYMFVSEEYAVENAAVYAYDAVSKEQKFVFSFERCTFPGSCFPDELARKGSTIKEDELYSFLSFYFPVFASPENHDETVMGEILIRIGLTEIKGSPMLDYWIEPSFDDELNKWLDDRPDKALYDYATVLLNAFRFIQLRMLEDQQRIIRFQNREAARQLIEPGKVGNKQPPRKIKIGCIRYQYIPVEGAEKEIRSFTRHAEAWSVRGHYRQLKSGKRVFIRPYTKGKGRMKQTEYVV